MISVVPTNKDFGYTRITPLEGVKFAHEAKSDLQLITHQHDTGQTLNSAFRYFEDKGLPTSYEEFSQGATHIKDFETLCLNVAKICLLKYRDTDCWNAVRLWRTPVVKNQKSGEFGADLSELNTNLMVDFETLRVEWFKGFGISVGGSILFGDLESGKISLIVLPQALQFNGVGRSDSILDSDDLSRMALAQSDIELKNGWLRNT